MSWPVHADTAGVIDVRPPYVGTTASGGRALGKDTAFVTERTTRLRREGSIEENVLLDPRTLDAIATFSRLTGVLRYLLDAPESDEFGPVRPTVASSALAKDTLFPLVQQGFALPEAVDVGTDHDGALRIVWENGPRFLELVVPYDPNAAAYLYYSHGDQYNLQRDLTLPALRDRFNWLSADAT